MSGNINFNKAAGIFILAAFSAMAVSVLCLASIQMNAMSDCSSSHGLPSICPFMSASVPAVFNIAFSAEQIVASLMLLSVLFAISIRFNKENTRIDKLLARVRQLKMDNLHNYSKDNVIALISNGILHSRVFSF